MPWFSLLCSLAVRAAIDWSLAADLVVAAWRFRSRRWYRRVPFLPLPAMAYVRWRMHTAYGDHHAVPPIADVMRYARWARRGS